MSNVVILQQPLYGSAYWNGSDFVYTPNEGYDGNDSIIYIKTENQVSKTYLKYFNIKNTAPIANTLSLTADAYGLNSFAIDLIASDSTNPFNEFIITGVSPASHGKTSTDGQSIFYSSNGINCVEDLSFTVSDKQYTATGHLTLSVINGNFSTTKVRTNQQYIAYLVEVSAQITYLAPFWSSMSSVMETYGPIWDSIDSAKYAAYSDIVEKNHAAWSNVYNKKNDYDTLVTLVCSYSGMWNQNVIDGAYAYNTINERITAWDSANAVFSSHNDWDNFATNFQNVTSNDALLSVKINSTYDTITSNIDTSWDLNNLNSISANNFANWDSYHQTFTQRYNDWSKYVNELITISANIIDTSVDIESVNNLYSSSSALWDTTELNAFSASYIDNLNDTYSVVGANSPSWNSMVNIFSSISSDVVSVGENASSAYDTYILSSVNWSSDELNSISANNFDNWNNTNTIVAANSVSWGDTSLLSTLSTIILDEKIKLDDLYDVVAKNYDFNNWEGGKYTTIVSDNSAKWDRAYQFINIESVPNKYAYWNQTGTNIDSLSNSINQSIPIFNSITNLVSSTSSSWGSTSDYAYNELSIYTPKWSSVVVALSVLSGSWKFDETDELISYYNTLNRISANNDACYTFINANSAIYESNVNVINTISAECLTGSFTNDLSAKDLEVLGKFTCFNNISTYGTRVTINTDVFSVSSFVINNNGTTDALNVSKTLYGNIASFYHLSSIILNTNSQYNTVSINTKTSNESLFVDGNISATGYAFAIFENFINDYTANSAKYENVYTQITATSADILNFTNYTNNYDAVTAYIELSGYQIMRVINSIPYLDGFVSSYNTISAKDKTVQDYITLSGDKFGYDNLFRNNSANYDTIFDTATATLAKPHIINNVFSFNRVISSDVARIIIPDNITIDSWTLFSDVSTNAQMDILSGHFYNTTYRTQSITNGSPLTLTNSKKNSSSDLSGWKVNICKGSILTFNLTQNTAASALSINLKVRNT
jgi:hypothetical protein